MPESYPFPMFSGLLEPKHYKQIGPAIWLFLWCVSSTTKEVERDGITWGVVLGNKPVKREELSEIFGVDGKTVGRWIRALEDNEYIKVTRAPYGMIFTVKNSKKYQETTDKNVHSLPERVDKNVQSDDRDRTKMSDLVDKNVHSNKDITKILKDAVAVVEDPDQIFRLSQEVADHFVKRRGKGFDVSPADFSEIQKMVADGVPLPIIKTCIDRAFDEYKPRHKHDEIRSISYCVPRCYDEWTKQKTVVPITSPAVPHVGTVALGTPKLSYQERRNLTAKQKIKEAEERERKREPSQEVVLCHPE